MRTQHKQTCPLHHNHRRLNQRPALVVMMGYACALTGPPGPGCDGSAGGTLADAVEAFHRYDVGAVPLQARQHHRGLVLYGPLLLRRVLLLRVLPVGDLIVGIRAEK